MRVDSGIQVVQSAGSLAAVPNISAAFFLMGFLFVNTNSAQATVELTDGNGKDILPPSPIAGGATLIVPGYLLPVAAGAKWQASTTGINGQVWGYQ